MSAQTLLNRNSWITFARTASFLSKNFFCVMIHFFKVHLCGFLCYRWIISYPREQGLLLIFNGGHKRWWPTFFLLKMFLNRLIVPGTVSWGFRITRIILFEVICEREIIAYKNKQFLKVCSSLLWSEDGRDSYIR